MISTVLEHPVDEELVAYALEGGVSTVAGHISECPACARFVKEIRLAREGVTELPDDDIPADLARRIKEHAKPKKSPVGFLMGSRAAEWYQSPLVIGLGVIFFTLFIYFFFRMLP